MSLNRLEDAGADCIANALDKKFELYSRSEVNLIRLDISKNRITRNGFSRLRKIFQGSGCESKAPDFFNCDINFGADDKVRLNKFGRMSMGYTNVDADGFDATEEKF